MKKFVVASILFLGFSTISIAQPFSKAANNAFLITRMVEKYHIQPRKIDPVFSNDWFNLLMNELDDDKLLFTQEDIDQLSIYRYQLQDQVSLRRTNFIQLLYNIYQKRLLEEDSSVSNICKTAFKFTGTDIISGKEDSLYAPDKAKLLTKLAKHLKSFVLECLAEINEDENRAEQKDAKKYDDSLEFVCRKKAQTAFRRIIQRKLQAPGGLAESIGNDYCRTLAECFDPHTAFFPLTEKENFESMLGNKKMVFGFKLDENDEGTVVIDDLKPGSPAFKSGQLNKGDKIIAIQWEGKESIDVTDASIGEIGEILDASNHNNVTITIKKPDGTTRQVTLSKEKDSEDSQDDGKIKSFLLKGKKTIGFISLPNFYTDWDSNQKINEGCTNDISKEILKLKKENIEGLILDLRYNGGGSMAEATELAGIFIDAGPVAQLVRKDGKIISIKDINRGTIYDGPLVLMVNGYSASASEMVAGTLQDYNRAIIAGSNTFGKATAQVVLPLDTTINLYERETAIKKADSYIKLTIEKLYRVSGSTAQVNGIVPDIILPELEGLGSKKEADYQNAVHAVNIEANKYFKPYPKPDLNALQTIAKNIVDTTVYFKKLTAYNKLLKKYSVKKDIQLNLKLVLDEHKKNKEDLDAINIGDAQTNNKTAFSVDNNSYELIRLKTDHELMALNELWKKHLINDARLQVVYQLLSSMSK